jgi:hypothetical protein
MDKQEAAALRWREANIKFETAKKNAPEGGPGLADEQLRARLENSRSTEEILQYANELVEWARREAAGLAGQGRNEEAAAMRAYAAKMEAWITELSGALTEMDEAGKELRYEEEEGLRLAEEARGRETNARQRSVRELKAAVWRAGADVRGIFGRGR